MGIPGLKMKKETSQVANELIKRLDTHLNDERIGNPFFPERGVRPFPLTTDGFKVIQRVDSDKKPRSLTAAIKKYSELLTFQSN